MISVRPAIVLDIPKIHEYWVNSNADYLRGIGADPNKIPSFEDFNSYLTEQINLPLRDRKSNCLIIENFGKAIGHCNTNPSYFGEEAFIHIHLWDKLDRNKGYGISSLQLSLNWFFKNLELKRIIAEPKADNIAINSILKKSGFSFIKSYLTNPGSINFEQDVNLWVLRRLAE